MIHIISGRLLVGCDVRQLVPGMFRQVAHGE